MYDLRRVLQLNLHSSDFTPTTERRLRV